MTSSAANGAAHAKLKITKKNLPYVHQKTANSIIIGVK